MNGRISNDRHGTVVGRVLIIIFIACACKGKSNPTTEKEHENTRPDQTQSDEVQAEGSHDNDTSVKASGPAGFEPLFPLREGMRLSGIVVDDDYLYMNKDGTLYRGRKTGDGTPEPLAGGLSLWVHSLVIDGDSLYWFTGKAIMRLDTKTATQSQVYAPNTTHDVMSLAVGDQRLYLVAPGCAQAFNVSTAGTDERTVTRETSEPAGGAIPVAIGVDAMYCGGGIASWPNSSDVYRWSKSSDSLQTLYTMTEEYAGSRPQAQTMLEIGSQLYIIEAYGPTVLYHRLLELPKSGGTPKVLAELKHKAPSNIHHDINRKTLYWVTPGDGYVVKYDLIQQKLETKDLGVRVGNCFTADDSHLYWDNLDGIVRMEKF